MATVANVTIVCDSTRTTRRPEAMSPAERLTASISTYDALPGHFADRYDAVDSDAFRTEFVSLLPPGDAAVLEAGCGTGRDLAGFVSMDVSVVGLDLSRGLLRVAAQRVPGVALVRADVRAVPLSNGSVRGVWAMASLVHLDRDSMLEAWTEARRILVPGGLLFATVMLGSNDGWRDDPDGHRRWFVRYSVPDVLGLASGAGLAVEQVTTTEGSIGGRWINMYLRNGGARR